ARDQPAAPAAVLLVLTFRPEFEPPWPMDAHPSPWCWAGCARPRRAASRPGLSAGGGAGDAALRPCRGHRSSAQGARARATREAESCFRRALQIAREHQAKGWELPAATSLARLLRDQGRRDEARALLQPVYAWFTEGLDTADLKDARHLLEKLG
ncbi:MAG: hypothetical protein QNK04_34690, partial [Myxococcota bacterium]|nr:hypothetical protein [Myxococcota bacterium]